MVSLLDLWLPVLLSAVGVFFVSFIVHAVINWHAADHRPLPDEDSIGAAIRKAGVGPGNYRFPWATSNKDLQNEATLAKFNEGPVGYLTLYPNGVPAMGKALAGWFIYCVLVTDVVAYVCSRTLEPGAEYLAVFRVAGTVAFLAYAGSEPIQSIFHARSWATTLRNMVDGLLYGLVTAGFFAWLWPSA